MRAQVERAADRLVLPRQGAELIGRDDDVTVMRRQRDGRVLRNLPRSHDRLLWQLASHRVVVVEMVVVVQEQPGPEVRLADADDRRPDVFVGQVVLPVRPQGGRAEVDEVGLVVVGEETQRLVVGGSGNGERLRAGSGDDDVDLGTRSGAAAEDGLGLGHRQASQPTTVDVDNLIADEQAAIPGKKIKIQVRLLWFFKVQNYFCFLQPLKGFEPVTS